MNKVGFLAKIALAASVFATITFTVSCSDDSNKSSGTGKWCVRDVCNGYQEEEQKCIEIESQICQEIGATYNGYKFTENFCVPSGTVQIQAEKPEGCTEPN